MQDWPLLVWRLIDHAAVNHGAREIVSLLVEGGEQRYGWAGAQRRAKRAAAALAGLGVAPGDRVATLAWNTHRHLECWYGIAGMGAVAHTVNPRLFDDQIVYILNHAEDRIVLFDTTFLPLLERLAPRLKTIEHYIVLTTRQHMPVDSGLALLCYEDLLDAVPDGFTWRATDENDPAGLCYTSGTTGNPKGVVYSHRSNTLHAYAACMADTFALGSRSVVLPIVPMYHANAWSIPYATAAAGSKLVLAGPHTDAATLQRLIVDEGVTFALGVPTVWQGLLHRLEAHGGGLGKLASVAIGGSAVPRSMIDSFERSHNITARQLWGMTEMSPLGTLGAPCPEVGAMAYEAQLDYSVKQGRAIFGVEIKAVDDDGGELPRDGRSFGRLLVKGPWVVERYYRSEASALDADGWFDTGDVATIDALGYMQIVDRSKDVIKSGGEWISSIDLENAAVGAAGVFEAAVIGVAHPKWDERPLLIVVKKPGASVSKASILAHLTGHVAKWWLPDDVVFVEALPHTATGKLLKTELRRQYSGYIWPV